ncbi:hypothetical protein CONLIGDRAFT_630824 [Coniochaeta ligniaria NRRL 30616]|uniref:Uncharacterized protein n=1 Tax=Coniochaeta ligniaria NRRL 30616 TaxID=1408157 RepID=A0A1J7JM23_9PEZI|nr:hypothetical protein CONLIGDRAFT_630824 [Coniochaeta ligniaria NRRL 30616]
MLSRCHKSISSWSGPWKQNITDHKVVRLHVATPTPHQQRNHPTEDPYSPAQLEEDDSNYDEVEDGLLFYFSGREMRNARPVRVAPPVRDGSVMPHDAKKGV